MAGDVGRLVGTEPEDGVGSFLGPADASDRDPPWYIASAAAGSSGLTCLNTVFSIGVAKAPGTRALMRMFRAAYSRAADLVSATTAAFAAA